MRLSRPVSILFLAAISAAGFGQSSTSVLSARTPSADSAASASRQAFQDRTPRYRVRKSDALEVDFALTPDLNQTISVQPDGYITLKNAGTIYAEGLTVPELTEKIRKAYAGILHNPIITVELRDFDKPYFIATGQVGKPGKYDLRSDLTVTEAVAVAGGFTEASKHSQVVLFRPMQNGMTEAKVINVKKMLRSRDLAEDIHLEPGDMIYVPKNRLSKIERFLPTTSLGMFGYPQFN